MDIMATQRMVSDPEVSIKVKDLKSRSLDYPPLIEKKSLSNGRQNLRSL